MATGRCSCSLGDPLKASQEAFDVAKLDAASQAERFGYNCDYVAFMPLPKGSKSSDHGLLCVNNEYASAHVMFENLKEEGMGAAMTKEQVALCNMAIGHSIVEVKRTDGAGKPIRKAP